MLKITNIEPSRLGGRVEIEGYVNGKEDFQVTIDQRTHKIEFITINDETVYTHDISLLEDPITNPISVELMASVKMMIATEIRTIKAGR